MMDGTQTIAMMWSVAEMVFERKTVIAYAIQDTPE
jgi:hypothetical protein